MFGNRKMQSIDVNDLRIEEPYNRTVKKSWCLERAKDSVFLINLFSPIHVSLRDDGQYYVIDGQHRVYMAKLRGITSMDCVVHIGLTYAEEALLFVLLNTEHRKTNPTQNFKALLEAHDSDTEEIKGIIEDYGLYLSMDSGDSFRDKKVDRTNGVRAVKALQTNHKKYGVDLFSRTIRVIKLSWDGHPDSLSRPMINSVATFLKVYKDEVTDNEVIEKFKTTPATTILLDGKTAAKSVPGGATIKPYARELLRIYNSGKPISKRLDDRFDFVA